ncbi:hypothetical protein SCHPADRAFT_583091 [Schizopora paradoxa]|uniref:Uncharacterized protein n=1 Tax=Schizopora paradoxa TaxID=27342 RepID=A0A0H2RB76_9AGAM|nr:hypothetical protein SCHPADRAFT_583091 [Schizopora paradoxa]
MRYVLSVICTLQCFFYDPSRVNGNDRSRVFLQVFLLVWVQVISRCAPMTPASSKQLQLSALDACLLSGIREVHSDALFFIGQADLDDTSDCLHSTFSPAVMAPFVSYMKIRLNA